MAKKDHRLIVNQDDEQGCAGVCSCGRSGFAGGDRKAVKRMHKAHVQEAVRRGF